MLVDDDDVFVGDGQHTSLMASATMITNNTQPVTISAIAHLLLTHKHSRTHLIHIWIRIVCCVCLFMCVGWCEVDEYIPSKFIIGIIN